MSRLYLFSPRCVVRDATQALLERAGHRVVGAEGDPQVAASELTEVPAEQLLADLRWGAGALRKLLDRLDEAWTPRVLVWLSERGDDEEALRLLPPTRIWAWVPALTDSRALCASLDAVAEGRRLPPPWPDTEPAPAPLELTPLDRLLLRETALGQGSSALARRLGLTPRQVSDCRRALMQRLGLRDLAGIVRFALQHGLIDARD